MSTRLKPGEAGALEARPCCLQPEVRQAETEKNSTMLLQSEVRQAKRERDSTMLLPANKRDVTSTYASPLV